MADEMRQVAPFPMILAELIQQLRYKAGWTFRLSDLDRGQGSAGLTLIINITGPDSYHPERTISVNHYMPVPPAAYDGRSWQRWLCEQVLLVERHEACEFFGFSVTGSDGMRYDTLRKPYAPSHGPGNDPYLVREVGTLEDQRTSFRGEINA
jgi:hypothetical protein